LGILLFFWLLEIFLCFLKFWVGILEFRFARSSVEINPLRIILVFTCKLIILIKGKEIIIDFIKFNLIQVFFLNFCQKVLFLTFYALRFWEKYWEIVVLVNQTLKLFRIHLPIKIVLINYLFYLFFLILFIIFIF